MSNLSESPGFSRGEEVKWEARLMLADPDRDANWATADGRPCRIYDCACGRAWVVYDTTTKGTS